MCCGNNSKFKQLSLGKSGDCLEISQKQVGFWFLFVPSFHLYLDSNIFSSYFCFFCCHVNIPKTKIHIKPEMVVLVFRHYSYVSLASGLKWAKTIRFPPPHINSQWFLCFRSNDKIPLCSDRFLCARSAMKLTHGIAAAQTRAADLCAGNPLFTLYGKCKHNTSSSTAHFHCGSQEPHGFISCLQYRSHLDLVCDNP